MSDKISILCPHCQKRYSVPADVGDRKVKCKSCDNVFRTTEAQRVPRKSSFSQTTKTRPASKPVTNRNKPTVRNADIVEANIVSQPKAKTSRKAEPSLSLDGMFKQSLTNQTASSPSGPSNAPKRIGPISQPERRSNPRMTVAIVGSILASVVLIPLCWILNIALAAAFISDPAAETATARRTATTQRINNRIDDPTPARGTTAPNMGVATETETTREDRTKAQTRIQDRARPKKEKATYSDEQKANAKIARLKPREFEKTFDGSILHVRVDNKGVLGNYTGAEGVALSGDRMFVACSNTLLVYDWKTKTELCCYDQLDEFDAVTCIAVNPAGTKLLVGGKDHNNKGIIELCEIDSAGELLKTTASFRRGNHKLRHLLFSLNGQKFASADEGKRLTLWDLSSKKQIKYRRPISRFPIATLTNRSDGDSVLATHRGEWTRLSWEDGSIIGSGEFSSNGAQKSSFSPSGTAIATTLDKNLIVYSPDQQDPLLQNEMEARVSAIVFLNEDTLAVANRNQLTLWDLVNNQPSETFELDCYGVEQIVASEDETKIAIMSSSSVYLLDLEK